MKSNFLLISFYRITNPYSGASEVSYDLYKNLPNPKKLFQYSEFSINKNNVITIQVKSRFQKLLKLFEMAKFITANYNSKKKNIIIFEGASWIGYVYIIYNLIKKKFKKTVFIYHSHNIEYLLRKERENFLIAYLTKYFEQYISKKFNIFTCVSKLDQKKLKKLYGINAQIFRNGVNLPKNLKKIKIKKLKFNYIMFSGSIKYKPNFLALKILINKIMPLVNKQNPNIKLIVTGNNSIPFKKKFLINVGFLKKNNFFEYLKGASLFVNTVQTTFGTQLKIINALIFGKTIISTKVGLNGIFINSNFKNVLIGKSNANFADLILKNIKSKKINKSASKYYLFQYSLKNILKKFLDKNQLIS